MDSSPSAEVVYRMLDYLGNIPFMMHDAPMTIMSSVMMALSKLQVKHLHRFHCIDTQLYLTLPHIVIDHDIPDPN